MVWSNILHPSLVGTLWVRVVRVPIVPVTFGSTFRTGMGVGKTVNMFNVGDGQRSSNFDRIIVVD